MDMMRSPQMPRTKGPAKQVHPSGQLISVGPEERERLKARRIELEMHQDEIAARVGVAPATISNLETGRSKQVKKVVYAKIYRALYGAAPSVEATAIDKDEAYRRIVEGALELNEGEQAAVAALIEKLREGR